MNKKYIRITVIAMLCAIALIVTDIATRYQYRERKSHEISEGFNTASQKGPIKMGMKSKTDTFKVDDVTFDIYYGMYEEGDETPKSSYKSGDEYPFFAMYMYEMDDYQKDATIDTKCTDYKKFKDYYFIKEIPGEEAFSGAYAYTLDEGFIAADIEYKHNESITVMKELFSKNKGTIIIKISTFVLLENGEYRNSRSGGIVLDYEFISDDTVQIEYRHN